MISEDIIMGEAARKFMEDDDAFDMTYDEALDILMAKLDEMDEEAKKGGWMTIEESKRLLGLID
jgi:soluble cytochrome b562